MKFNGLPTGHVVAWLLAFPLMDHHQSCVNCRARTESTEPGPVLFGAPQAHSGTHKSRIDSLISELSPRWHCQMHHSLALEDDTINLTTILEFYGITVNKVQLVQLQVTCIDT